MRLDTHRTVSVSSGVMIDRAETDRPPPPWPSALACAAVAAWVDLGSIQRLQHADSLLYPMISRWGWTPFS